ncbi:MAG: M16 family metallopeptidase [Candidatus Eisenbacteria bacterium]
MRPYKLLGTIRRSLRAPALPILPTLPALPTVPTLLALLASVALATLAHASTPPGFLDETLPNGLRVTILPDSANPVVATHLWYHIGSANEPAGQRGIAHLFEHMMFHGTASHGADELDLVHQRYGGRNNAYTSWDETYYVSEIDPAGHDEVLAIEADRMLGLSIGQENLDRERKIVIEELRGSTRDDPMTRVMESGRRAILGDHPYALRPTGLEEDLRSLTVADMRSFYERYYRPRNAHLVIVGPVDGARTFDDVVRLFGSIPAAGETPADPPDLMAWTLQPQVDITENVPPANLAVLAYLLPPVTSPDYWAIEILRMMLVAGQVDPFKEDLVTRRGRAVDAATVVQQARRGGAIFFGSAALPYVSKDDQFRHLEESVRELGRMEWLTPASFDAALRKRLRSDDESVYFAEARAKIIARMGWWFGDPALAFDRREKFRRVTYDQVADVFRRYVLDATAVRIYVRPEHVPWYVKTFGRLYPVARRWGIL